MSTSSSLNNPTTWLTKLATIALSLLVLGIGWAVWAHWPTLTLATNQTAATPDLTREGSHFGEATHGYFRARVYWTPTDTGCGTVLTHEEHRPDGWKEARIPFHVGTEKDTSCLEAIRQAIEFLKEQGIYKSWIIEAFERVLVSLGG